MTGALLQLVAYGKEDLFLTHNPEITLYGKKLLKEYNYLIGKIDLKINIDDFVKKSVLSKELLREDNYFVSDIELYLMKYIFIYASKYDFNAHGENI